ncbi:MAG: hypothetical protein FWF46_03230 [Oscillospiraceae bacterium]|nr:hypothetical protein [Oscillospiraceae bacterium]
MARKQMTPCRRSRQEKKKWSRQRSRQRLELLQIKREVSEIQAKLKNLRREISLLLKKLESQSSFWNFFNKLKNQHKLEKLRNEQAELKKVLDARRVEQHRAEHGIYS